MTEPVDDEQDIVRRRIVIIGKTGGGKSSTCNNIFNKKVMVARVSPVSLTSECQVHEEMVFDRLVTVCDTPGIFDTRLSEEEVRCEIINFIGGTFPGPHAIIMVIKASNRFGKEDQRVLDNFKELLGEDMFEHMIVLFTGRDDMEADDVRLEDFIQNAPEELKRFLDLCKGRYIFFNKRAVGSAREMQVKELFAIIENILAINGNSHYTNEMYIAAERILKQKMREGEEQLKEERKKEEEKVKHEIENKYTEEIATLKNTLKEDNAKYLERIKEIERKMQDEILIKRKALLEKQQEEIASLLKQQMRAQNRSLIINTLKDVGLGLLNAIPNIVKLVLK